MRTQRLLGATLTLALAMSIAPAAWAASLALMGGGRATVIPTSQLILRGNLRSGIDAVSGSFGGGLAYVVTEPSGRVWSGSIPGTKVGVVGEPTLAQNPVTADMFVVFARNQSLSTELAFSAWTGQSWTEPQSLTSGPGSNTEPLLSFGEVGEAVLSWRHEEFLPTILVRHFEMALSGPTSNHSFSDLGSPDALLRPAGGPTGLRSGLVHGLTDSFNRETYLFVSDAERDQVGLVRLQLQALYQGGGFNAPPVPVAIVRSTSTSVEGAGSMGERVVDPAALLTPWRLSLTSDTFAYYWVEADRLALVLFRNGMGGGLVSVPLPANEAQVHAIAYHAALREYGFLDRRGAERTAQRRR